MMKLAYDGRLPQFDEAFLTSAKIRDRTYGDIKIGSEIIFCIIHHLNAWRNEFRMQEVIQGWLFDFNDLSLKKVAYNISTVGITIRRLMESRSDWKGTRAELLVELGKVVRELKIDINDTMFDWPKSSRRLKQILQDLEEYLETYGITIEMKRYIKLSRTSR